MQFKVPQNIDLADKIVGPLTLNQFIELTLGGVMVYILLTQFGAASVPFILIGIPIGLFSVALAFLKINEQPFGHFVLAFLRYTRRPKIFTWHKTRLQTGGVIMKPTPMKKTTVRPHHHATKSELQKLAFQLDTRGHALKPEKKPEKAAQ